MAGAMHPADVTVNAAGVALEGSIALPEKAAGIVVFAHGSGSSRLSPRNRMVAQFLNQGGLGTLLFDLLTARETEIDERTGATHLFEEPGKLEKVAHLARAWFQQHLVAAEREQPAARSRKAGIPRARAPR